MTLQQLDAILKTWQGRLSAMAEGLLELQSDENYRALTGEGGLERMAVDGETAALIKAPLQSMHGLFRDFGALQSVIDHAATLRAQLPALFGADGKAREIQRLLFAASVQRELPEVPPAERTFLQEGVTEQRCTPDQLLQDMARRFEELRETVRRVGKIWDEFSAKALAVREELSAARAQQVLPTALLTAQVNSLEAKLTTAEAKASSDPVGALGQLGREVEPALAQLAHRLRVAEEQSGELRVAAGRLKELRTVQAQAQEAEITLQKGFTGGARALQAVPETKLQGLEQWLDRLQRRFEQGEHEPLHVGLRNWCAAAELCLAQSQRLVEAAGEHLNRQAELGGRFEALRAKAHLCGLKAVAECKQFETRAKQALGAAPVDLERAARAVQQLEEYLLAEGQTHPAKQGTASR